jgi:Ataxin-1 and HBP1 module (AXH)
MKRIIFLISILCLFQTCTKDSNNQLKCDCSQGYPETEPIYCPGQLCQSDSCQTFFNIWKDLFLSKNQMSQEYFDDHITLCSTTIHIWAEGTSFEIFYKVKIGWAEYRLLDKFIFYIASSLYPGLDVPRNVLLSKSQIETVLNGNYFGSKMSKIIPADELKYTSETDAMKALIYASHVDTFCIGSVSYPQKSFDKYTVGHPYFIASGVLNWNDNKCIEGSIDLITGETYIKEQICYIIFCFSKGTQIMQYGGSIKPIDKIKIGDKILSVNLSTMKVEEDIVQKVDSVIHNDMVTIEFNDMTTNSNTSDHPYLVKGKGWSSFKPKITMEKYKIKTSQMQIGDTCFKYQSNRLIEVYVKSITENNGFTMTYNISNLKRNNSFFANGILVSNESY